jgi:hypothetical protein
MPRGIKENLVGQVFGMLKVTERIKKGRKTYYLCECKCGNKKEIRSDNLKSGTESCGCLAIKTQFQSTHGKTGHRLHNIWMSMIKRCTKSYETNYENYGGRGIKICDEWLNDFMSFYNWAMENEYSDDLSIDRIDVNGDYEPSNCRWATPLEQQNNIRRNFNIDIEGESKSISEWSRISEVTRNTIYRRFNKGVRGKDLLKPVNRVKSEHQSNVKGIRWDKAKGKWRVTVRENQGDTFIGMYKDLDIAINAQNEYLQSIL